MAKQTYPSVIPDGAVKKVPRQTNGSQAQKRAWESFVFVVQFNCNEKPYHVNGKLPVLPSKERRCLKTAKTAELRQRLFIHGTRDADNFTKGQKRAPEAEDETIPNIV